MMRPWSTTTAWFSGYHSLTVLCLRSSYTKIKSSSWVSRTFLMFNFSLRWSLTSSTLAKSISIFYIPWSYLSYLPLRYSKIGMPLSSCRPNECTRLSTIIKSFNPRFFIILKSFIKKPLWVYIQFFLFNTPWIVLFFSLRYYTIG